METITDSNKYEKVFANLNEILVTNTNNYKVVRQTSKSSNYPIITINTSFSKDGYSTICSTIIRCFALNVSQRDSLGQEIENLMISNIDNFDKYNMEIKDRNISSINASNETKSRLYPYKEIIFRIIIK